jgi:hypothetical protein
MAIMGLSSNKVLFATFLLLAVFCIYVFISDANSKKDKTGFKDVGPFQQYWLDPYAYDPNFAKDIYIVPGQARLPHNLNTKEYDNSYLPYESAIPAVDVLRANNKNNGKILPPSYYTQVIRHNTTPYSAPVVLSQ